MIWWRSCRRPGPMRGADTGYTLAIVAPIDWSSARLPGIPTHIDRLALRKRGYIGNERVQLVAAISRRRSTDGAGHAGSYLVRQRNEAVALITGDARKDGSGVGQARYS